MLETKDDMKFRCLPSPDKADAPAYAAAARDMPWSDVYGGESKDDDDPKDEPPIPWAQAYGR